MPLQASLTINCQTAFQSRRFLRLSFNRVNLSLHSSPPPVCVVQYNFVKMHQLFSVCTLGKRCDIIVHLNSFLKMCLISHFCHMYLFVRDVHARRVVVSAKKTPYKQWPRPLCTLFQLFFFCAQFSMHILFFSSLLLHTLCAWFRGTQRFLHYYCNTKKSEWNKRP